MKLIEVSSPQDLENIKKAGIYKISVNYKKTDECYIGSTTRSFQHRWLQHLTALRRNVHENSALQNIVNKHGLKSLVFEIVEVINDDKILLEKEQYWINYYDSYNRGYNCIPFAQNTKGRIVKESTKEKFYKKVSQYSLDGDYIATFKSLRDAAEKTNTDKVTILNCCKKQKSVKTAGGYQWRYGDNKEKLNIVKVKKNIKVGQYDEKHNLINVFLSMKEAAKYIGAAPNTLSTAIKRNKKSFGYYWKKIN